MGVPFIDGANAQTLLPPQEYSPSWGREFPLGDFNRSIVDYDEILSGGPPRDGIPAIDAPKFISLAEATTRYAATEPVIGLQVNGEAKAYPLQILTWHEIANDIIGGVPVAVTYCPCVTPRSSLTPALQERRIHLAYQDDCENPI